ncbi:unnamed protein product, partial [marine sediment metagenome]
MKELESEPFLLKENINQFFNSIPIPSYIWQKKDDDFILIDYNSAAEQLKYRKIIDIINGKASEIYQDRPDIVEAINRSYQEKISISLKSNYTVKTTGQKKYNSLNIHHLPPDLI